MKRAAASFLILMVFFTAGSLRAAPAIENPGALKAFFQQLDGVKGGGKARMVVYGDSLIMGDQVIGPLRTELQKRFGNGGPGFLFPAKTSRWYNVVGVVLFGAKGWKIHRVTTPTIGDGLYGLAGATFLAGSTTVSSQIECDSRCPWKKINHYEVFYLKQPKGGSFEIKAAGKTTTVNTAASSATSGFQSVKGSPDRLDISIAIKKAPVRLFGVVAENDKPGVVVDTMPLLGARMYRFNKIKPKHLVEQMSHRAPGLVVLMFGTNESEANAVNVKNYKDVIRKFVKNVQKSNPRPSILLVGPPARGIESGGTVKTKPIIRVLDKAQSEVAKELGCAYFSLYKAMGGRNGAAAWNQRKLLQKDYTHFTRSGARKLGMMLYHALMTAYGK